MQNLSLNFVDKQSEIRSNIARFNQEANVPSNEYRARDLLRRTRYWVYDEATDAFGPSKFVGFASMTFECYDHWVERAKTHKGKFLGEDTRRANENALAEKFASNVNLSKKLLEWGEKLFDADIFRKVYQRKWRFIKIPKKSLY
jgi:hypothetical protein